MKFHNSHSPFHSPFVGDKAGRLTCRACGNTPAYCWSCRCPTCPSCTREGDICGHCRRPPRPNAGDAVAVLVRHAARVSWQGLQAAAGRFGADRRTVRRANRRLKAVR